MTNNTPRFINYDEYKEWIKNNNVLIIKEPPEGGTIDLGFIEQTIPENDDGD
jgi:hypothetical protein